LFFVATKKLGKNLSGPISSLETSLDTYGEFLPHQSSAELFEKSPVFLFFLNCRSRET